MRRDNDPHYLARELLGRDYDDLEADEQRVLRRVAAGTFTESAKSFVEARPVDLVEKGELTRRLGRLRG